jgi:hypothetical protein
MLLFESHETAAQICGVKKAKTATQIAAANVCLQGRTEKRQGIWTGIAMGAVLGVVGGFFLGRTRMGGSLVQNIKRAKFMQPLTGMK